MTESSSLNLTIKRRSNKKAGFEVEQQEDGFYYISKVPKNCKKIGVGDRVLEINGTMHSDFKSAANANDLVDSFRLEVAPVDDNDEDEDESDEEYEEVDRSGSKSRRIPVTDPIESEEVDDSARSDEKEFDDSARSAEEADDSARSAEEDDDSARSAEEDDDSAKSAEEVDDSDRSENHESHGEVDEDDSDYGEDSNDGEEVENEEPDWDEEGVANNISSSSGDMAEIRRGVAPSKSWERPYVSQYKAHDRFMISVTKEEDDDDLGIDLIEYQENEIYVSEVNGGPFYATALNRGDKIISVNGKKVSTHLHSVDEVMDLINSKSKIQIFALRPSPDDGGYNWVHEYMSSHFSDH